MPQGIQTSRFVRAAGFCEPEDGANVRRSNARGPFWSLDPLLGRTTLTMRLRQGTSKVYLGEVEPYSRR